MVFHRFYRNTLAANRLTTHSRSPTLAVLPPFDSRFTQSMLRLGQLQLPGMFHLFICTHALLPSPSAGPMQYPRRTILGPFQALLVRGQNHAHDPKGPCTASIRYIYMYSIGSVRVARDQRRVGDWAARSAPCTAGGTAGKYRPIAPCESQLVSSIGTPIRMAVMCSFKLHFLGAGQR